MKSWIAALLAGLAAGSAQAQGIGLLGDSVTAGGHTSGGDPVGYAFLLRDRLPGPVHVFGCAGTTSLDWVPPAPSRTCTIEDPDVDPDPSYTGDPWGLIPWSGVTGELDVLVVALGINDGLTNVSAADYGEAIGAIVDHVFANQIAREVHLVRPSRLSGVPGKDGLFAAYGDELHSLALQPNVSAGVDLWAGLDPRPNLSRWPHGDEADLVEDAVDGVEVPALGWIGRALLVAGFALAFSRRR